MKLPNSYQFHIVFRGSEQVTFHKIVIAAEFVEMHARRFYNPYVTGREALRKDSCNIFKTPPFPSEVFRVACHDIAVILQVTLKKGININWVIGSLHVPVNQCPSD